MLLLIFLLFSSFDWRNQTGNQIYQISNLETPATLPELQEIVQNSTKVKAIGGGYSLSNAGQTSGTMISLNKLNHILYQDGTIVKVETGITLRQLNKELFKRGLALPNLPATDEFTLGGVISTGAHGSGRTGTLSSFVNSIDLVTADGNILYLTKESEAFHAAALSIGALGVIYAVELECVPSFYLEKTTEISTYPEILSQYQTLLAENDYFSFFLNIKTDEVEILKWNKSNKGIPSYESLCWYKIEPDDKEIFSEIAVPFEALPDSLSLLREKLKGCDAETLHIRFVDQDNSLLSPAYDGKKAYIAICLLGEEKALPFFQDIEDSLIPLHGRPHWGKIHFLNSKKVEKLYGPNYTKFKSIMKQLDPAGKFTNPFLDMIFSIHDDSVKMELITTK